MREMMVRWLAGMLQVACCVLLVVQWSVASAQAPPSSPSGLSYAELTFLEGQRLYFEKRYEDALALFEESHSLQKSPNSRLYIARCLVELDEFLDAYEVYREVIVAVSEVDEPARYAATQLAASEERAALRGKLAVVRISLSEPVPNLHLVLSGREIQQQSVSADHFTNPGVVTLETTAPGYRPYSHSFEARGGEVSEVFIILAEATAPPPAPVPAPVILEVPTRHPAEVWAWASAGVGVVGLATWGTFATQAERRFYRIKPLCDAGQCPVDQVEQGRQETWISNVGLGVGIVGLAGAGALWVWSRTDEERAVPSKTRVAEPQARPEQGREENGADAALYLGPGSVELRGTF